MTKEEIIAKVKAYEEELKKEDRDVARVEVKFDAWQKYGKDRTYINVTIVSKYGKKFYYGVGFVDNTTGKYDGKMGAANIARDMLYKLSNDVETYNRRCRRNNMAYAQ